MSYTPNSLTGVYRGDHVGEYYRVVKGDTRTRSSDNEMPHMVP